jgi:O-antigen/teichoic acid export membrane protein
MKLIKDSLWSLLSVIIPAILAIPVFSVIAKQVGLELFGIYTLSFAIIGYSSIFDLGLSRALTREIAMNIGNNDLITQGTNTAFTLIVILSAIAGILVFTTSDLLVGLIGVSAQYYHDVLVGIKWLSASLITLLINNIWWAYFEGFSQFKTLSIVKIGANVLIIVLPCLTIQLSPTFTMLMLGLFFARLIVLVGSYFWLNSQFKISLTYHKDSAKRLFNFGGWFTVSTVIGPIMVYFDRFMLSYVLGAKSVAFYTAPSELVVRMLSLPSAVGRTLFARLSNTPKGNEHIIYWLGMASLGLMTTIIAGPLFVFAEPLLVLWLGEAFRGESAKVFQILLIGFVINAIAQIPFANLQAKGQAKLIAILHCVETIPYLILLYILTSKYGLIGVAWSWTLRILADTLILLYFNKLRGGLYE